MYYLIRKISLTLIFSLALFPAWAQAQSAFDLEYYANPDPDGVNNLVFADSLVIDADLSGVVLTFDNTRFEDELVTQSPVGFSVEINAVLPDLTGKDPMAENSILISEVNFEVNTSEGEILFGTSVDSHLSLVPYAPAPRVLFFELVIEPNFTSVEGVPPGTSVTFERVTVWGILITNGVDFEGVWGFPQSHRYDLQVSVSP